MIKKRPEDGVTSKKESVRYDAFISYSHAADNHLGSALQKALHTIARPWYQIRALNVFRDQTNLSATPHLWSSIEDHLQQSKFLILLASPEAASSRWVQKEVEYWMTWKSPDTLLIALTGGDIVWSADTGDFDWSLTTALPENLKGYFAMEPLYADFRAVKSKQELFIGNPEFKNEAVLLAAALHGKSIGDIVGEDITRYRQIIRLRNGVIFLLSLLSFVTLGLAWLSNTNALEARRQEQIARERGDSLAKQLQISDSLAIAELAQRRIAEINAQMALDSASEAQRQRRIALSQTRLAEAQRDSAAFQRDLAIRNQMRADSNAAEAQRQQLIAEKERATAIAERDRAEKKTREALAGAFAAKALQALEEEDFTKALLWAEKAYKTEPTPEAISTFHNVASVSQPSYYNWQAQLPETASALLVTNDNQIVVVGTQNGHVYRYTSGADTLTPVDLYAYDLGWLIGEVKKTYNHESGISVIASSSDGKLFASGDINGLVLIWNDKGERVAQLAGHRFAISSVAFSPDYRQVLTGSEDNTVILWGLDGNRYATLQGHTKKIHSVAFSESGHLLASLSLDQTVCLWSREGRLIKKIKLAQPFTRILKVTNNNKVFLSDALMERIGEVDVQTGRTVTPHPPFLPFGYAQVKSGNRIAIHKSFQPEFCVIRAGKEEPYLHTLSPDAQLLVTIDHNQNLKLWPTALNREYTFDLPTEILHSIDFHPSEALVLAGGFDGYALIDYERLQYQYFRQETGAWIGDIAFSPWGNQLMVYLMNGDLKLLNRNGILLQRSKVNEGMGSLLAFHDPPALFGSGNLGLRKISADFKVENIAPKISSYSISSDQRRAILEKQGDIYFYQLPEKSTYHQTWGANISATTISADNKFSAVGWSDEMVIFDIATGELVKIIPQKASKVHFLQNSSYIAVAEKSQLKIMDWSGRVLQRKDESGVINKLKLSNDGKWLAMVTARGKVILMPALDFLLSPEGIASRPVRNAIDISHQHEKQ